MTTHSRANPLADATPAVAGGGLRAVASGEDPVLALVDLAGTAATAYARPDLAERLGRLRGAITESPRVLVLGADQAARTELVTAMVGTLLPGHGRCQGRRWSPGEPDVAIGGAEAGVVLIDTPDLEHLGDQARRAMAALPAADAVVVLAPAATELTGRDLDLVRAAVARCPVVAVVMTQLERHPQWRRVYDRDCAHLGAAGIEVPLLAVSTGPTHGRPPVAPGPGPGGQGALTGFLLERVAAPTRRWRAGAATGEVLAVCEQLAARFHTEIAALEDPQDADQPQIADIQARAAATQQGLARWQQTLSDGISDLVADIDHDLRERLRAVITEAEQALDAADPIKTWDQFAAWLHTETTTATTTTFSWADQRTAWLAGQVAAHFRAGPALPGLPPTPPPALPTAGQRPAVTTMTPMTPPEYEKSGLGESALSGLRGGYGGLLMVGLISTTAGLALLNPWSIGAGAALGAKTVADERRRGRRRRQAEAKAAVRRHIDDLLFQLGKDSRDRLRDVHRALRDHYAQQAEQLSTALAASLEAAAAATSHRDQSLADRRAELARLNALADQATAIRALYP